MVKDLYPSDLYMSPHVVIARMNLLIDKYGQSVAFQDSRFKEEREAAITALYLLGYRKITNKDYWIGIRKEDPPDNVAITLRKRESGKGIAMDVHNFEIFEWEAHSEKSLLEAIKKKLVNKAYPLYYTLLCYVRRPGDAANLEDCFRSLQQEKIGVNSIWLVSSIQNGDADHTIAQLYPGRAQKIFKLAEELEKIKDQKPFLTANRGVGEGFEPLGDFYLPLP
jgi:hypothetical protein